MDTLVPVTSAELSSPSVPLSLKTPPTPSTSSKNETMKALDPFSDGLSFHEEGSMRAFMFGDGPNPKTVRLVRAISKSLSTSSNSNNYAPATPTLLARIGYFAPTFDANGLQSGLEWFDGIRLLALSPRFVESIGFDGNCLRIKLCSSIENGKTIWFSPLPRLDDNITNDNNNNTTITNNNGSVTPTTSSPPETNDTTSAVPTNGTVVDNNAMKDAEAWSIFAHSCASSFLLYWQERINRREAAVNNNNNKNNVSKKNTNNTKPVTNNTVGTPNPPVPVVPTVTATDPSLPNTIVTKPQDTDPLSSANDNDDSVSVAASRTGTINSNNLGPNIVRLPSGQIVPARKDRAGMSRKEYRQMLLDRHTTHPRGGDIDNSNNNNGITNDNSSNYHNLSSNSTPYPETFEETEHSTMINNHHHRNNNNNLYRNNEASAFTTRNNGPRNNNNRRINNNNSSSSIHNTNSSTTTVHNTGSSSFMASLFSNNRNNNTYPNSVVTTPSNDVTTMNNTSTVDTTTVMTPPLPPFDPTNLSSVGTNVQLHNPTHTNDYHHYTANSMSREYYPSYVSSPANYSSYGYPPTNIPPTNYAPMNMIPMNYNTGTLPMNYSPSTNTLSPMSLVQLPNGMMGMVIPTTPTSSGTTPSSKNGTNVYTSMN